MKTLLLFIVVLSTSYSIACAPKDISVKSTDPISGAEFLLQIKAYIPKGDLTKQVIVLPPIGGVTTLEAKYAGRICKRGTSAYVFYHWTGDMEQSIEDLGVHQRGTTRGLHAVETFLVENPLPTRVLGTSLGGIYAGVATGKFDLIEKTVIIASGTNLSQIMATSSLPELVDLKNKRFAYHGFENDQEYAQAIKDKLYVEASSFKENFKNKKLLFIRTNADSVISTTFQDELINLFDNDNSQVLFTKYGHKNGIIMAFVRRAKRISNFLAY